MSRKVHTIPYAPRPMHRTGLYRSDTTKMVLPRLCAKVCSWKRDPDMADPTEAPRRPGVDGWTWRLRPFNH